MRRSLVIVLTIAVLGGLSVYAKHQTSTVVASPTAAATTPLSAPSSSAQTGTGGTSQQTAKYNNGTFTGDSAETPYGTVQIAVVISGGRLTDVQFLQMPNDLSHSAELSYYSAPLLKQTTLQAQNTNIEFVSGATSTSYGYQESLQAALDKARIS